MAGAGASRAGNAREHNEDAWAMMRSSTGALVAIVVDGMGGRAHGERAAALGVEILKAELHGEGAMSAERLLLALRRAHERLQAEAKGEGRMGAAAAVAVVEEGQAWLAHTGDVRIYRIMGGGLCARLTRDMTALQEKLDAAGAPDLVTGGADGADARVLRGFLGQRGELRAMAPRRPIPLVSGDRLVLATDGAYGGLTDDAIGRLVVGQATAANAAEALVTSRSAAPGDDATAVVLWIGAPVQATAPPRSSDSSGPPLPAPGRAVGGASLDTKRPQTPGSVYPQRFRPRASIWLAATAVLAGSLGWWFYARSHATAPASELAQRSGGALQPASTNSQLPAPETAPSEAATEEAIAPPLDWLRALDSNRPAAADVRAILKGELRQQLLSAPRPQSLPPPHSLPPPLDAIFAADDTPPPSERASLLVGCIERAVVTDDLRSLRLLEAQLTYRTSDPNVKGALGLVVARHAHPLVAAWAESHLQGSP